MEKLEQHKKNALKQNLILWRHGPLRHGSSLHGMLAYVLRHVDSKSRWKGMLCRRLCSLLSRRHLYPRKPLVALRIALVCCYLRVFMFEKSPKL